MGNLACVIFTERQSMRQWYVDAWQVYGYDLFNRFTALWGASDIWWTALRVAGKLRDVYWTLSDVDHKLDSIIEGRQK